MTRLSAACPWAPRSAAPHRSAHLPMTRTHEPNTVSARQIRVARGELRSKRRVARRRHRPAPQSVDALTAYRHATARDGEPRLRIRLARRGLYCCQLRLSFETTDSGRERRTELGILALTWRQAGLSTVSQITPRRHSCHLVVKSKLYAFRSPSRLPEHIQFSAEREAELRGRVETAQVVCVMCSESLVRERVKLSEKP